MDDPYAAFADPVHESDPYAAMADPVDDGAPALHTYQTIKDKKVVQFQLPETATDEEVRAAAVKATGSNLYSRSDVKRGDVVSHPPASDDSVIHAIALGAMKPIDKAAELLQDIPGVRTASDAIAHTFGMQTDDEANAQNDAARADNSRTGWQGVGNVVGTLPLMAVPGMQGTGVGAMAAQGSAAGALLSDAHDAVGIGLDAVKGAAASVIGSRVVRGAASLVRGITPNLSPALRTLIDAGVRVSPGQYARSTGTRLGNMLAVSEERATSSPILGALVSDARLNAADDFSRATVNRALAPVGHALPAHIQTGRDAVRYAGDHLSAEYDRLLPHLRATGDQQFMAQLSRIHTDAATMAPARVQQFQAIVGDLNRFWTGGTQLDGQAFKAVETRLGGRVRTFLSSPDADQRELGQALQSVQQAVRDLAERQNPAVRAELAAVNRGWASLAQVERAGGNSHADITPAGYSQAVKLSSATVRRRGYARGQALNQDLSDAASDILPSRTPDSGTAGRLHSDSITANLIGAAKALPYAGMRAAVPLMTRGTAPISPAAARMLDRASGYTPQLIAPVVVSRPK